MWLQKKLIILCDKDHECITYTILDQDAFFKNLYLTHNDKLSMKTKIIWITRQFVNATCDMQSLKNDFYLGTHGFLFIFYTHEVGKVTPKVTR